MKKNAGNPVLQKDVMRYKKNKFGANLALIGLALGCIYFLSLYSQVKNDNFYYTWAIEIGRASCRERVCLSV